MNVPLAGVLRATTVRSCRRIGRPASPADGPKRHPVCPTLLPKNLQRMWGRRFRVCPNGADYQWGKDPLE